MIPGGKPVYSLTYDGKPVIDVSRMGLEFKSVNATEGFRITGVDRSETRGSWVPVWGENAVIADNYNSMTVRLMKKADGRTFEMDIGRRTQNDRNRRTHAVCHALRHDGMVDSGRLRHSGI